MGILLLLLAQEPLVIWNEPRTGTMASLNAFPKQSTYIKLIPEHIQNNLKSLIEAPKGFSQKMEGPYISKKTTPQDGWNHDFYYKVTPGGKHPYDLFSYGPHW